MIITVYLDSITETFYEPRYSEHLRQLEEMHADEEQRQSRHRISGRILHLIRVNLGEAIRR